MKYLLGLLAAAALMGCPPYGTQYLVYYDGNGHTGGTVPKDTGSYYSGDTAKLKEPGDMVREGYVFGGWQKEDYSHVYQPGEKIRVEYDLYLQAYWQAAGVPLQYRIEGESAVVTGYYGDGVYGYLVSFTIPSALDGKPVKAIAENAFVASYLTYVTLPSSLETIGAAAFSGCKLTSLIVPASVRSIGAFAFANNAITKLTIPGDGLTVGDGAFSNNPVDSVQIGSDVTIETDSAFGIYGKSFRECYTANGKQAGNYTYSQEDKAWSVN